MGGGVGGACRKSTSEGSSASSTVVAGRLCGVTARRGGTPAVIAHPGVQSFPCLCLSGQLGQPGQSVESVSPAMARVADALAFAAAPMPAIIGPLAHAAPMP